MDWNSMVHDVFITGTLVMALINVSLYAALRRELKNFENSGKTAEELFNDIVKSIKRLQYAMITLGLFAVGTAIWGN